MGLKILSVSIASLVFLGFIDAFINWYGQFLDRHFPFPSIKPFILRLSWVILAIIFWLHIYLRRLPESFDTSYFLFVAFIYSIKGLITSFFKNETS